MYLRGRGFSEAHRIEMLSQGGAETIKVVTEKAMRIPRLNLHAREHRDEVFLCAASRKVNEKNDSSPPCGMDAPSMVSLLRNATARADRAHR